MVSGFPELKPQHGKACKKFLRFSITDILRHGFFKSQETFPQSISYRTRSPVVFGLQPFYRLHVLQADASYPSYIHFLSIWYCIYRFKATQQASPLKSSKSLSGFYWWSPGLRSFWILSAFRKTKGSAYRAAASRIHASVVKTDFVN